MKKIIKHKLYDTDKAEMVVADRRGYDCGDRWSDNLLYHTRKGAWFMVKQGGALSCYAERDGRDWVGSSRIEPISENEARNFCKKYGDPEDYANYFPDLMQA